MLRYTCRESAEIISPLYFFARRTPTPLFPVAVGPTITMSFGFLDFIRETPRRGGGKRLGGVAVGFDELARGLPFSTKSAKNLPEPSASETNCQNVFWSAVHTHRTSKILVIHKHLLLVVLWGVYHGALYQENILARKRFVGMVGVEPTRETPHDFESCAYTNSATCPRPIPVCLFSLVTTNFVVYLDIYAYHIPCSVCCAFS